MKVVISKGAKKDLSKLDQFTQRRILGELIELETSLIGKDIILALKVGHRREIYR